MDKFVAIFGTKEFSAFIVSATAGSFAIELVYLILAIASIRLVMQSKGVWWQYLVVFRDVLGAGRGRARRGLVRDRAGDEARQRRKRRLPRAGHRGVAPLDENVDFTPAPPDTAI